MVNDQVFYDAMKKNYMFKTPKGDLNVLQLFQLSVPLRESEKDSKVVTLEDIELSLQKEISDLTGTTSSVRRRKKTASSMKETMLRNKLEIVQTIIDDKFNEYEARLEEKVQEEKKIKDRAMYDRIIENKEFAKIDAMSLEEIKKLRDAI